MGGPQLLPQSFDFMGIAVLDVRDLPSAGAKGVLPALYSLMEGG